MSDWKIFQGDGSVHAFDVKQFDKAFPLPPWRKKQPDDKRCTYKASEEEIAIVNAALLLRRPLLLTGDPGVGKSSLAYAIACELDLGEVLHWHISTKSTVEDGLYNYDAIARLQEAQALRPGEVGKKVEEYVKLNPLGQAFGSSKKRVLLIDEIDKSDIDLPNDLLQLFEDNYFEIDVLKRMKESPTLGAEDDPIAAEEGRIYAKSFPIVIMTSNDERDFPPAFMRRCLHHRIQSPDKEKLIEIVQAHLQTLPDQEEIERIVDKFLKTSKESQLATDQLLNAFYLRVSDSIDADAFEILRKKVWHRLSIE